MIVLPTISLSFMSIFLNQLRVPKLHSRGYWNVLSVFINQLTINLDHTSDNQLSNNLFHITRPLQELTSISKGLPQ
jgi:hypothetical protein